MDHSDFRTTGFSWRRWLWVLLLWPVVVLAEPRTALVVGNAGYRDSPLNNPVNDARDLAEALRAMDFEVVQRENLDKRGFDVAVSDFARRLKERGGVGLFYYSGHGAQVKGENYLIPVSAAINSEADVEYEAVNAGRILRNMEQAGNGLNIVVLDACRNNPYRSWYRSETKGLARMDAPTGSIVAYATAPGTVAADGAGRNSPYTAGLLQAMRTPGLGVEQLFKQVRIQVAKATSNRQVPWESSSLMGDFFFVSPASTPSSQPPTPVASASGPSPFRPPVPKEAPPADSRRQPGQVFRDTLSDGTRGPAMVVIPAGDFQMGSPPNEPQRDSNERQHRVRVASFAMGQYEVTFEEYDRFCAATGREKPSDEGWGRGRRPVINVDWNKAVTYTEWLSKQTGKQYRLPTEAEWEYAARAGTTTPFWAGRCVHTDQANYLGYGYGSPDCGAKTGVDRQKTLPVGSFKPNPWGLYDTMGNVWEWTCSAFGEEYDGAEAKCHKKDIIGPLALRGGAWTDAPAGVRSAARYGADPAARASLLGFRLARSL
ncbi:MAG: SUMF1/EgtB/PvdO family nonheme iron enzyme [Candidatus Contendobacter sp.]|nr:SUMF1/EgtB/PvdO family nonheme iron enzyme [Candidatus Contendobacter sp.]MDS4058169.1 SUMF1/EgtB/PvdO family nonheme iron enzyme [Candidatus Contendobacter sp.]